MKTVSRFILASCLALSGAALASERGQAPASIALAPAATLQGVAGTATAITYTITGTEVTGTIETYKVLAQGQLPSSVGVIYTVPASTSTLVSAITLANATGSPVTGVKIFIAGSAAANQISGAVTIPANGTCSNAGSSWSCIDGTASILTAGGGSVYTAGPCLTVGSNQFTLSAVPAMVPCGGTGAATLTAHALLLGEGTSPVGFAPLGTTTTVLHGNPSADPIFGAVVSADLNITTSTCSNQFVTAISAAAAATCTTDVLASAQHANQGTTTQVLHGNAVGNPIFGAVALGTDVSGILLAAQFPALAGDCTTPGASLSITCTKFNGGTSFGSLAGQTGTFSGTTSGTNTGDITMTTAGSTANANGATLVGQQLQLQPASASFAGMLPAIQSAFLTAFKDKTVVLATANQYASIACDGTTDDSANWNTLLTGAPNNSLIVIPGCTSMLTSGTNPAIPSGKHFTIKGAGQSKTNIQSNNNTADFFTVNDWYNTFDGLTFQGLNTTVTGAVALSGAGVALQVGATGNFPASGNFYVQTNLGWTLAAYTSVTDGTHFAGVTAAASTTVAGGPITVKTGGYAVNGGANAHILLHDVQFNYVYNGFLNNATLGFVLDSSGFGTVNFDLQFNGSAVNAVVHNYTTDGLPPAVSHIEVNQAGSLLISDSDIIRGQTNLRLNPTSPNGVFGVYVVNTYLDTATGVSGVANSGNAVLIQGTGNVQRIKISSPCWLSSATHDGFWSNSTAATLPTDIEVTGCNIYSNGHDGFNWQAGQDFIISANQISGNVNAGVELTAAAAAATTGAIQHNQIGPAGGIGANGTGIIVNAGTYGNLDVDYNDLSGNTTASQSGLPATVTAPNMVTLDGNIGMFVCPPAQAPATVLPITTVTEAGTSCTMKPGARVGSWARITTTLTHLSSSTATMTPSLHYGTANSNADSSMFTPATLGAGTAVAGTCQMIWEFDVVTATTANITFKWINGNNAATGCGGLSSQSGATAPVAITNINTQAFLGAYIACSVASCATVQEVKYEYGQ